MARCAYCLGLIDVAEGHVEDAVGHFTLAREHADRASNPGGKAAAMYQLALLAMAKSELSVALEHALQSYVVSREAKQYLAGAATLVKLFEFLSHIGLDSFAEVPGLDLLSLAVVAISEHRDDARQFAASALRALAPLNAETRAKVLRGIGERFGEEVAEALGRELDATVALLCSRG